MNLPGFELLLKQSMGLDANSLSASAITRAIHERMKAHDLSEAYLYENLLRSSEIEMQELIEIIVVPETSFFRDREAFATLGRVALAEWPSIRPGDTLRLLSLPCSTGEEPYSMAMTLFDAGLPPHRFHIDAIDLSRRVLELGRSGFYGKNSFRGGNLDFRDRYFESIPPGWQLVETVRHQVHFEQGNMVHSDLLPGHHIYDAIFCRNVLIYFDHEARKQVIATLDRLLAPHGILFMGPSETSLLPPHQFVPARLSHSFAFRKTGTARPREKAIEKPTLRRRTVRLPAPRAKPRPFSSVVPTPPLSSPAPSTALDDARRLADQGRLVEAATQCEKHLHREGPSAQGYYLLGLIRDAGKQQAEAIDLYRKALYLEPRNEEVLTHLASLLKNQGDLEGAQLLLNRARRLNPEAKA